MRFEEINPATELIHQAEAIKYNPRNSHRGNLTTTREFDVEFPDKKYQTKSRIESIKKQDIKYRETK